MCFATVIWFNSGNRFALIKPDDSSRPYLVQLTLEEAMHSPLAAGQRIEIRPSDADSFTPTTYCNAIAT